MFWSQFVVADVMRDDFLCMSFWWAANYVVRSLGTPFTVEFTGERIFYLIITDILFINTIYFNIISTYYGV